MMNTKCSFCGHKQLQSTQTQYIYKHDDKLLIVNDVPCRQCGYCGERYFDGQVLRHIEKKFNDIYVRGQQASQEVPIPVEHFPTLQPA